MTLCLEHGADDLADVVVTSRTPIANINFAKDSYHSQAIIEHLGISLPLSGNEILDFFEFQAHLKDRLVAVEGRRSRSGRGGKPSISEEAMRLVVAMTNAKKPPKLIRERLRVEHGVVMSPSNLSHLRRRMLRAS